MHWNLPYTTTRQPVLARNMVATSQPLAAQAGAAVFARGGNAIDAALATAIALTVVEPTMNGIGGDAFALVWDGKSLHGLNASGRSPKSWNPRKFSHLRQMPRNGWDTVTVPGGVAAWLALSERFGALPFEDLFVDAIRHARDGFPVSPVVSRHWEQSINELGHQPGFEAFMPNGRAPRIGEIWRFEDQAETLEEIAKTRTESFYRGRLAARMADFSEQHGAGLSLEDLAAHKIDWVDPISVKYGDRTVHEIPPNGQGLAALIALGLLEYLPYRDAAPRSATRLHLEIEAMRMAFSDLYAHVADPAYMKVTPAQLLDPAYLRERAKGINHAKAGTYLPGQPPSGGTVYLCTADAEGRMVSFIQSNFKGFGSGVVVPDTGIALHNRGMGFVTTPGHPNQVDGDKRPMHSIIPAFMMRNGQPHMAFGVMGGNMQAQGHVQMTLRETIDELNPQACSDAPRWRINDAGTLTVEHSMDQNLIQGLKALGHQPEIAAPDSLDFGSAQLIRRVSDVSSAPFVYVGGSDHRRDGQVIGY